MTELNSYNLHDPALYPDCKALLFFLAQREAYRPIIFSPNEIFCGPDCQSVEHQSMIKSFRTPSGVYSIEPVIKTLPPNQQPDVIIIKADATARNFPVGLRSAPCPKVLILGNTQHLNRPLRMLLDYARQEKFDWVITDHKRHHLHYFCEAGFRNVHWIPGFNVFPHPQPEVMEYKHSVSFIGQTAQWHPYRRYVLEYLRKKSQAVEHMQLPQQKAAQVYAESKINLNCSLNGDMNLRIFEVLSSGGFLLTDQLSKESGLDLLFEDGVHLRTYKSPSDLQQLIQFYMENSGQREKISRAGKQKFWEKHRPEQKAQELFSCVFGGDLTPEYKIERDKRAHIHTSSFRSLYERVSLYEHIQELHLQSPTPLVCFASEADRHLIDDCHDLPRLNMGIDTNHPISWAAFLEEHQYDGTTGAHIEINPETKKLWDLLVIKPGDWEEDYIARLIHTYPSLRIALLGECCDKCEESLISAGLEKFQNNPQIWQWKNYSDFLSILLTSFSPVDLLSTLRSQLTGNTSDGKRIHILGLLAYRFQDKETAGELLEQAVFISPKDKTLLLSTVDHYCAAGLVTKAIPYLQRLTALFPERVDYLNMLGNLFLEISSTHQALETFRQSLRLKADQLHIKAAVEHLQHTAPQKGRLSKGTAAQRILIINNLFPPQELGGYGRLLFDFTELLRGRGYQVQVLTSDTAYLGQAPSEEKDISRDLELFGEWKNGITNSFDAEVVRQVIEKNVHTLNAALQAYKPDVCLFGNADFIGADLIFELINRRVPVLQHLGNPQPGYPPEQSPGDPLYRLATASRWLRDEIWRKGYPLKHIDVIYPGALVDRFYQADLEEPGSLSIAYAGIVLPYKGPQILIKALLELESRGIPFSATIAGTSTDMTFVENLKRICARAGLSNQVHFTGNLTRDELVRMYKSHNVLVFPSLVSEAFGISQVEAMASGACVITSATGGAAEIVQDMQSGLVFKSGDHLSLTGKLLTLHHDHPLWDRLRRQGQKRAFDTFDIKRSVDQIEEIFEQLSVK
ncbi:MAG: glycosyltransferase [Chitinispirillaceae bacterium]